AKECHRWPPLPLRSCSDDQIGTHARPESPPNRYEAIGVSIHRLHGGGDVRAHALAAERAESGFRKHDEPRRLLGRKDYGWFYKLTNRGGRALGPIQQS